MDTSRLNTSHLIAQKLIPLAWAKSLIWLLEQIIVQECETKKSTARGITHVKSKNYAVVGSCGQEGASVVREGDIHIRLCDAAI